MDLKAGVQGRKPPPALSKCLGFSWQNGRVQHKYWIIHTSFSTSFHPNQQGGQGGSRQLHMPVAIRAACHRHQNPEALLRRYSQVSKWGALVIDFDSTKFKCVKQTKNKMTHTFRIHECTPSGIALADVNRAFCGESFTCICCFGMEVRRKRINKSLVTLAVQSMRAASIRFKDHRAHFTADW